ncbi:MAG TPA: VWA domain-containing protein [bacterium]|nr:VWA domain-containing protein [bacterium]HPS29224.1 VWA domain-containing protein [bacterium]
MKFFDWKYLLVILVWFPVIIVWMSYSSKKRGEFLTGFSKSQIEKIQKFSIKKIWYRRIVIFLVLILLSISAARPLIGGEDVNTKSDGIDIAVVFDVSLSMYAEDENGPRYEKGKKMMFDVLSSLTGDRVALIPFAGAAFLQMPLTDDYETLATVVSVLEPGMIEKQGTSLGTAVEMAVDTLKSSGSESDKLIVVISDGEDPDLDFDSVSKKIKENNIHLAILPLGTEEGAPVRIGESYLKDENENTVVSRIDKGFFEKCTTALNAFEIKKGDTISSYIKDFKKTVRNEERTVHIYIEKFQIPLLFAIVLYFLFIILSTNWRKS